MQEPLTVHTTRRMRKRHSHKNFDVSHAAVPGEYSSIEVFDSSRNMGWSKHKSLHSSLLKHFSWCPVFFLSAPSQLKITSKEMVLVNELLSHLFDHESDRVECVWDGGWCWGGTFLWKWDPHCWPSCCLWTTSKHTTLQNWKVIMVHLPAWTAG